MFCHQSDSVGSISGTDVQPKDAELDILHLKKAHADVEKKTKAQILIEEFFRKRQQSSQEPTLDELLENIPIVPIKEFIIYVFDSDEDVLASIRALDANDDNEEDLNSPTPPPSIYSLSGEANPGPLYSSNTVKTTVCTPDNGRKVDTMDVQPTTTYAAISTTHNMNVKSTYTQNAISKADTGSPTNILMEQSEPNPKKLRSIVHHLNQKPSVYHNKRLQSWAEMKIKRQDEKRARKVKVTVVKESTPSAEVPNKHVFVLTRLRRYIARKLSPLTACLRPADN